MKFKKKKKSIQTKIRLVLKKAKQFDPIMIEWRDATTDNPGWTDYDSVNDELITAISGGLFFSHNEESITIVQSYFKEECPRISESVTIPKSIITNIRVFKKFKK